MSANILLKDADKHASRVPANPRAAWRILGWFGLLLLLVGLGDALVNWYPLALRSPEWEFGTIASTFGALPLVTMGLAALLASFLARGVRWGVITMIIVFLLAGLAVLGLYVVFATDIPIALKATAATPASIAIRRGIARTTVLGLGFSVGYLAAALVTIRSLRERASL